MPENNPKKILIVSFDLPPSLNPQSIQISRFLYHLPRNYLLYVVTAIKTDGLKDEELYKDIYTKFSKCIKIPFENNIFSKMKIFHPFLYQFPDETLFWHIKAFYIIKVNWDNERFDKIITFSCPMSSNLLGMWLKKHFKVEWIAFFSDPWGDNPYFRYFFLSKIINRWLEKKVFINVDKAIFVSPEMKNEYDKKYPFINNKSFCITHSYDPALYKPIIRRNNKKFTVRYIGNIYGVRTPLPLLKALQNLINKNIIQPENFVFEIYGNISKKHKKLLLRYKHIVDYRNSVPYLQSLELMQTSDLLVLIEADVKKNIYFPSKLVDYIGASKPILAITPEGSSVSKIISKGCGFAAEPDSIESIEKILIKILQDYKKGILQNYALENNLKETFQIQFNINKFSKNFLD